MPQLDDVQCSDSPIFVPKTTEISRTSTEKPPAAFRNPNVLKIGLNKASRPSGRPKLQKAAKKKRKERKYEASEALAGRLTKHGDVTLANVQAALQKSLLSLSDVEDVFDGLRVFHENAIFKRPKAHLIDSGLLNPMYAASYQKCW
ncbi:hypothetical protein PI124_g21733 [Phytophthora idaei]|nr:hypothetical protein PI125_g22768 [Phytophthora idaei]KAG3129603.1 hypothetical protein PI126_g20888 [Phytophthora idaei]KAG3233187.1 hypothetical protein PI124_g21733 [Phytophthora idaei]